ncbi:MAG: DUF5615 family PIN-like protein [Terriglobales bacterium]
MALKFLIDECLSPDLVRVATQHGYGESAHITWLGKSGIKDWQPKGFAVAGDWTLVANNSVDFRGPKGQPGSAGHYSEVSLHAGLVCINRPANAADQCRPFEAALDALGNDLLDNKVIEVEPDVETGKPNIRRYPLPA